MNIQAIKRNCLAHRRAHLLITDWGSRWIECGSCAYSLGGLHITEGEMIELLDLSEKQLDKMAICTRDISDARYRYDHLAGESEAYELGRIVYQDAIYIVLYSAFGIMYMAHDLIKHIKTDYRSYAIRWAQDDPLIAGYDGISCVALARPARDEDARAMMEACRGMVGQLYTPTDREEDEDGDEDELLQLAK